MLASRSAVVALLARLFVLGTFGVSCAISLVEDPKEVRKYEAWKGRPLPLPPPRLHFADKTVVDDETGLEWQRDMPTTRFAWSPAWDYCRALQLEGGGWRLPARDELLSLMRYVDDPFGADPDWYWSASRGTNEDTAWAVGGGSWLNGNPVETRSRVRCVRIASAQEPEGTGR
jgi:hypothetical protein